MCGFSIILILKEKSKSPCIVLKYKLIETESIMENPTHNFGETSLVLHVI